MRDTERKREIDRGEPDVGLDPRTSGSCPEPKADAQPLSHSGIPIAHLLISPSPNRVEMGYKIPCIFYCQQASADQIK